MTTGPEDAALLLLYPDRAFEDRMEALGRLVRRAVPLNYSEHLHTHGITATEERIRGIISSEKISVVILFPFASDFQLSVGFYASLRDRTKVVLWLADDPTYFDVHARYYAQAADLVVTNDPLAVHAYRRLGVRAVYHLDIVLSNRLEPVKTEKDMDALFIGDLTKPGRKEALDFLAANGIKVSVFGPGTPGGPVPFEKMGEFFCRSRIVVNFSRVASGSWINGDEPLLRRVRQNTGRPVEAALAGAFCLTEYSPALETLFRPGEEIAVFHNKQELLEKIRHYLSSPEEREAMAAKAHRRARAEYEPETALRAAVGKVFAALREPLPPVDYGGIQLSRGFRRKSVNSLTFSFFILLRRGRVRPALELIPRFFSYGAAAFIAGAPGGVLRALSLLAAGLKGKEKGRAG